MLNVADFRVKWLLSRMEKRDTCTPCDIESALKIKNRVFSLLTLLRICGPGT